MVTVQQRGLGKGLSALISEPNVSKAPAAPAKAMEAQPAGGVLQVDINKLMAGKFQPRERFDDSKLHELSQSIEKNGIMQPLVVRASKDKKQMYEIIAGERRFRAARMAGLTQVPVIVHKMDDAQALEVALVENIQRQDLNPIEEAQGYFRLMEEFSYTQEELSETVGKSRSHIANMLRVLTLPESVKEQVATGALTFGHAKALVQIKKPEELAEQIVRKGLNVRQAEQLAKSWKDTPDVARKNRGVTPAAQASSVKPAADKDPDIIALENTLTETLGLKVTINDLGGQKGEIVVAYDNLTQLDEVLRKLGSN